jgi:hypothetical protein
VEIGAGRRRARGILRAPELGSPAEEGGSGHIALHQDILIGAHFSSAGCVSEVVCSRKRKHALKQECAWCAYTGLGCVCTCIDHA